MEYWKFVILTYISIALIEGIPTGNDIIDKKCKFCDFILLFLNFIYLLNEKCLKKYKSY